jgi:hypothetical protein
MKCRRLKMGFKHNYIIDINEKLMTKRFPDDIQTTLNIPIHKFKKVSEKFNYAIREVHAETDGAKMFHILLSLQEYFDMEWIVDTVLDDENKQMVIREMTDEYHIGVTEFKSKLEKPKVDPVEEVNKALRNKAGYNGKESITQIGDNKVVKGKIVKKKAVKKVKVVVKKKKKVSKKVKVVVNKKKKTAKKKAVKKVLKKKKVIKKPKKKK